MSLYKRGDVYWYEFVFCGQRIRESTKQGNKRVAMEMQAARRTELAKGTVGIHSRKPAPTLRDFAPRIIEAIENQCADKPHTVSFYKAKLRKLLAHEPLAGSKVDAIDESVIERYIQARVRSKSRYGRPLSPASVNRELATLRRVLRLAHEWKEIQRVPKIKLLRGERNREFVLPASQESEYLEACPEPLKHIAPLLLDTGLRISEALSLEWPQVHLKPASRAKFGYLTVLSRKAKGRKSRNVPLSERVVAILSSFSASARPSGLVFHRADNRPFSGSKLDQQHERVRKTLKLSREFVLHSLRHTFGTRLGESGADAFTIMRLMGHSSVTVSQQYVHPSPEALELAFERLTVMNRGKLLPDSPTAPNGSIQDAL